MSPSTDLPTILAIEDDAPTAAAYSEVLADCSARCSTASNLTDGLSLLRRDHFDVLLLDRNLGADSGFSAIPQIRANFPDLRIIAASAAHDTGEALAALRMGANDYLVKPFSGDQLKVAVARQVEAQRLASRSDGPPDLIEDLCLDAFRSDAMQQVIEIIRHVAPTQANVLLLGESGTGKTFLARMIHRLSHRGPHRMVTVHCPSLSSSLLENELFGHRRGAFTGANEDTEGKVAAADRGTLFFDEVGELPLDVQPKLLRLIQERRYERIGDHRSRYSDVRVIAATHRCLREQIARGEFRLDLFYRLNVIAITVPPLRERDQDVLVLADTYLVHLAAKHGVPAIELSACLRNRLLSYPWPGNVRELENVLERAVIFSRAPELRCVDTGLHFEAGMPCECGR